mmetsp:Transcript_20581/g.44454  ORF Transcript_20581/g.44454 Transcript_20581/m.44454 type:complete len:235 (+) Transcript_20581:612-1316(+)
MIAICRAWRGRQQPLSVIGRGGILAGGECNGGCKVITLLFLLRKRLLIPLGKVIIRFGKRTLVPLTPYFVGNTDQNLPILRPRRILEQGVQPLLRILHMSLVITTDTIAQFLIVESRRKRFHAVVLGFHGGLFALGERGGASAVGERAESQSVFNGGVVDYADETVVELLLLLGLRAVFAQHIIILHIPPQHILQHRIILPIKPMLYLITHRLLRNLHCIILLLRVLLLQRHVQ